MINTVVSGNVGIDDILIVILVELKSYNYFLPNCIYL